MSEARAYLDDLARVFPHGYEGGEPTRSLEVLPAQVVRYRGLQEGWVELEVALSVPEALRAGAAPGDSLELGLFVLGEDGRRLADVRDRIAVRSGVVRWGVPAGPAATRITLELYNRRNHHGAGLQADLRDGVVPSGRASDLVLVGPAADGEPSFRRHDVDVAPLGRTDRLEGDEVGIAFELYEVGDSTGTVTRPYSVHVELESLGGDVAAVPIRPRGESEFRPRWSRLPMPAAEQVGRAGPSDRTLEVLMLDLSSVPPGTYTLRVVVDLHDGGRIVRERPDLHRRATARGIGSDPAFDAGR
jgi:hypothetical protein